MYLNLRENFAKLVSLSHKDSYQVSAIIKTSGIFHQFSAKNVHHFFGITFFFDYRTEKFSPQLTLGNGRNRKSLEMPII